MGTPLRYKPFLRLFRLFSVSLFICSYSFGFTGWEVAGPFGGTATALAVDPKDPQRLLAGSRNSLLYRSDNGGNSWERLSFPKRAWAQIEAIVIDPADPQHYLIGVGNSPNSGLYESHDAGKTWQASPDFHGVSVQALTVWRGDNRRIVAGTRKGVYQSTDAGKTWQLISPSDNAELVAIESVALDPKDPNIIFIGTTHLPWKTMDGGKTWQAIHTGMIDDSDVFSMYVDPAKPELVLASACSGIYKSENQGNLWQKMNGIPKTHRRTHVIKQDPLHPDVFYAGTTLGLFRSTDRGTTWRQLNHYKINAITFENSDKHLMYLGMEHEGVWVSGNQGETLQPVNQGFISRNIKEVTVAGNKLYSIVSLEGNLTILFVSENQGRNWQLVKQSESTPVLRHIAGVSDNTLFASSERELYKSVDGGVTWKPVILTVTFPATPARKITRIKGKKSPPATAQQIRRNSPVRQFNAVETLQIEGTTVLFVATDRGLFRSTNLGQTWTDANPSSLAGSALALYSTAGSQRLVLQSSLGLFQSEDGGLRWRMIRLPFSASTVLSVAVPPASSAPLLVGTTQGLYQSQDNGVSWRLINAGIPLSTVNSVQYHPVNKNEAYAVEFDHLYRTADGGTTWNVVPTDVSARVRRLWFTASIPETVFGITSDIGVVFHNLAIIR